MIPAEEEQRTQQGGGGQWSQRGGTAVLAGEGLPSQRRGDSSPRNGETADPAGTLCSKQGRNCGPHRGGTVVSAGEGTVVPAGEGTAVPAWEGDGGPGRETVVTAMEGRRSHQIDSGHQLLD